MNFIKYLFVAMTTLISKLNCYNVEITPSTIKTVSDKENNSIIRENPTFFGYDVNVKKIPTSSIDASAGLSFDLYIGSPKTVNPGDSTLQQQPPVSNTQGNIQICRSSFSIPKVPTTCRSTDPPPDSGRGDAYGMAIALQQDGANPTIMACSPTKSQVCGSSIREQINIPGYCYNSSTFGTTWTPDPKTAQLGCDDFNLDLLFVLDGSGSVGADFKNAKNWVAEVSSNFKISDGSTRIGVIQYSHYYSDLPITEQPYVKTEIELGEYRNQVDLKKAINNITLQAFTTYTAAALNLSAVDFENSPRFHWENTSKVLVLLTDGNSSDASRLPREADHIRSLNVTTFAIGVGDIVESELRTIATGNESSNDRVYSIKNYDGLAGITESLKRAITNFALEGSSPQSVASAGYSLQLAEYGFSIQPSKITTQMRERIIRRIRLFNHSRMIYANFRGRSSFEEEVES